MTFVIAGKTYNITNLSPTLDSAFVQMHSAYLSAQAFNWDEFNKIALSYLADPELTSGDHNNFFNNFTIIWNNFLNTGKYDEAEHLWSLALIPAFQCESDNTDLFIHKGTPYYFWGATAIIRGDLDKGYSLIHQALQEDIRTSGLEFPNTPSFAFAMADYSVGEQWFRGWVIKQAVFIDSRLSSYRNENGKDLTLDLFRKKFLNSPPSVDDVYLFAYTVARLIRLYNIPVYVLKGDFVSQIQLNLLFDVALVIESAIKKINSSKKYFIDHILYLSRKNKLSLTKNKLRELNHSYNEDFDSTLTNLIFGNHTFSDGTNLTGLSIDLAVTYGVRNRGAHDLSSLPVIWKNFSILDKKLFNVLFLTVDSLY